MALKARPPHLVAEGVLLGRLHHARTLPAQLRHQRLQLGRAHGRAVVIAAQPLQRDVDGTVRPGAPDAWTSQRVSGLTLVLWSSCCTVVSKMAATAA